MLHGVQAGKLYKITGKSKDKSKVKKYKGKSLRPGGGGRFAKLTDKLKKEGKSEKSAKAIAATVGRKKFGAKKMSKWSAKKRSK